MVRPLVLVLSVCLLNATWAADCDQLPQDVIQDIASYQGAVTKIIDYYMKGSFKGELYRRLSDFVDEFGPRLTGTRVLENSIDYVIEASKSENLQNVHKEPVVVPYWNRGEESLALLKPRNKRMTMLGLGQSVATPPGGITARGIVVKSFDELHAMEDSQVKGTIVVYDEPWSSYGATGRYRQAGAVEAAKKGAVAALVRSVTPFSIGTPHTGTQIYQEGVAKIPFAAITHEDADLLWRLQQRNKTIELKLDMACSTTDATSYNVISEITGSTDKVVIVSGHIDSWDTGDGAMDDAGGSWLGWLAPVAMKNLGLRPKRTVRSIMFTGEEQYMIGAIEYERVHHWNNGNLTFVMESDSGIFTPRGIAYEGHEDGVCIVKEVLKMFAAINATTVTTDGGEPDIGVWTSQGIPGAGIKTANDKYFWYHHTDGDTINVMSSDDLDLAAALWTGFTYVMADMKYEIPRMNVTQIK